MIIAKIVFPLVLAGCLGAAGYAYYQQHTVEVTLAIPTVMVPPPPPGASAAEPTPRNLIGSIRDRVVVRHSSNPFAK